MRTPARAACLGLALALGATGAAALTPVSPDAVAPHGYPSQASVRPGVARLGDRVIYRGRVLVPREVALRWGAPLQGDAIEWGAPRIRRVRTEKGSRVKWGAWPPDTAEIEVPIQPFALGTLSVPGLPFEVREAGGRVRVSRLPVVRLGVGSVLAPQDASPALRPVRGPLAAPWWERLPWWAPWAAALVVALALLVVWLRRRPRRIAKPVARVVATRHPALVALEALHALRGLALPEQGRFAEHAFRLTRILRVLLERTEGAPRPGDTSAELVRRLAAGRLAAAELERVGALLAAWDRVKFARAATSVDEAEAAERAVEALARRRLPAERREAA